MPGIASAATPRTIEPTFGRTAAGEDQNRRSALANEDRLSAREVENEHVARAECEARGHHMRGRGVVGPPSPFGGRGAGGEGTALQAEEIHIQLHLLNANQLGHK